MDWLQSLISGESGSATQLIIITIALVIGLILIVWLFRRIASAPARRETKNRVARLSVTDVFAVDDKRFLVLVRRDNVEHLIMIGGPTDVVVESGIGDNRAHQPAPPVAMPETDSVTEPQAVTSVHSDPAIPAAAVAATGAAVAVRDHDDLPEEPETITKNEPIEVESPSATEGVEQEETPQVPPQAVNEVEVADEAAEPVTEEAVSTDAAPEPSVTEQPEEQIVELDVGGDESLEAAISENLEDALAIDQLDIKEEEMSSAANDETVAPEPTVADTSGEDQSTDDEMQKLLDELAGEKKEPAQ